MDQNFREHILLKLVLYATYGLPQRYVINQLWAEKNKNKLKVAYSRNLAVMG